MTRAQHQVLSLGGNPDKAGGDSLLRSEYLWRLAVNFNVAHLVHMAGLREDDEIEGGRLLSVYPQASEGEKHILIFLVELADGRPGPEGYKFDAVKAAAVWDAGVRTTFATWFINPFFP